MQAIRTRIFWSTFAQDLTPPLSLARAHTHTHTHTHIYLLVKLVYVCQTIWIQRRRRVIWHVTRIQAVCLSYYAQDKAVSRFIFFVWLSCLILRFFQLETR